ncbi:hypothetical protein [Aureimonas jatrophae]|uniref:Lipoprotein n=1 Tax=Aureimonas jatrophae TaxID=1166073 RepID=A0A1H0HY58_9HYPH|nr:hypothetical protein [Aureimonas jatrophae]MBB3950840.1 hypothetical protein [Aureimonas jatrophae]SDO24117.1 hypothetical protein SAMN05192530_104347 [Aureimonas jatrophae]
MRRATLALVVLPLMLSACVSASPEERRAADEAACRDYGFRPRTTAFAECLQRRDIERSADRRARLYGGGVGIGGAGLGVGWGYGRFY